MDSITLSDPLDMHVHFREGPMLSLVAPLTAEYFSGGLIMPNLRRPILSFSALSAYQIAILEAVHPYQFSSYPTMYFSTKYDRSLLESIKGHALAVKFYSKGMTTNSEHGTDPEDPDILPVLENMEDLGIPLCVHGEAAGYWKYRESLFHEYLKMWARRYPKLKIIIEHMTDANTVRLLEDHENLYATITPHHLLLTTDDFCGDTLQPHLFCKPLMKEPRDREALRDVALYTGKTFAFASSKVMLGTDSAPHDEGDKLKACGCAGIFTAPIALQLLATLFSDRSSTERFQAFVSDNAKRIYGLDIKRTHKSVTLERRPFIIPERYGNVVPMWAGQTLPWSIVNVS
jgi:dihydroorotase